MSPDGVPLGKQLHARGIDRATATTFRVGVVRNALPGHERYEGWFAIPYLDNNDKPLMLRFRCPHDHDHRELFHGKYMTLADEPSRMFNVRAVLRAKDTIHVTEGEFDAMILSRLGLSAVAVPGVQNWHAHFRRVLAGFQYGWVWGDPDDAGADFNRKVTRQLPRFRAVRLRQGDVTETFRAGGEAAVLNLITPNGDTL